MLVHGKHALKLFAFVDTGASYCLFQRSHGEGLGLEIESGEPSVFATATGRVEAFGHLVHIAVFDMRFESMVYFFADARIKKNLLGRIGWLNRVRIGSVDHDAEIYLSPYDAE